VGTWKKKDGVNDDRSGTNETHLITYSSEQFDVRHFKSYFLWTL